MYLRTAGICFLIYELGPACFLTASGLAWKEVLKKTKVKLDLLTNPDILLMLEKSIRDWNMPCYSSICKS